MIRKAVGAIVTCGDQILLVKKTKINTIEGKRCIPEEWDIIKGGVESRETEEDAILRELEEETGSKDYVISKIYPEKIHFYFPKEIRDTIGFAEQETTIFHVTYVGEKNNLSPQDNEITEISFKPKENVIDYLTHKETIDFFVQHNVISK